MPILIFLVVHRLADLRWAVAAATVWSVKVVFDRRRHGLPLGRFMPIITVAIIIRGAIGIITDSEAVYFGLGIASKYAIAAALLVSVLLRRPLAARAAPYIMNMPKGMTQHPVFLSTMSAITLIGALYYLASASFDIWLFRRSSVEGFVLLRFVASWPLSAACLITAVTVAQSRLSRIPGVTSVSALVEQRMAATFPQPRQGPADQVDTK